MDNTELLREAASIFLQSADSAEAVNVSLNQREAAYLGFAVVLCLNSLNDILADLDADEHPEQHSWACDLLAKATVVDAEFSKKMATAIIEQIVAPKLLGN